MTARGIKRVDAAIANVANQNVVAEWAEVGTRLGDSPGSVQSSTGGESPHEIAVHIENTDDTIPRPSNRVMLGSILHCIRHEHLISNHLNSERCVTSRQIRI